ncbi:MAG: hypothetical protein LBM27_01135 [Lactobacillaceae bacterium]|jgi:hypothetical protein|nr:hypothetical protein [Lactobacillaceae bacterium]
MFLVEIEDGYLARFSNGKPVLTYDQSLALRFDSELGAINLLKDNGIFDSYQIIFTYF